jgi:hypothetical protein
MKGTDEIICSHFGRASSQGKWKFEDSKSIIPKRFLAKHQINKWLKLSKKIIIKQAKLKQPSALKPLT